MRRQHEGPPRRRTQAARQRTGVQHQGTDRLCSGQLDQRRCRRGRRHARPDHGRVAGCQRRVQCTVPARNLALPVLPQPQHQCLGHRQAIAGATLAAVAICNLPAPARNAASRPAMPHRARASSPHHQHAPRCSLSPPGDGSGIARSAAAVSVRRRAAAISALQPGDRIRWSPAHRPALAARTWCAPVAAIAHRPRPHIR